MKDDPTYNINISGDLKQMIKELGTEKGKEAFLQGGGGQKAQKERAAALAAILARKEKNDSKSEKEPKHQPFSIVDAASASVHGRSAAAAKAASAEKTAARITMHMAGDRAPVNAKLVYCLPILLSYIIMLYLSYCVL
jgi:peptidyl-prolyl cis-trans isomerase-like 2